MPQSLIYNIIPDLILKTPSVALLKDDQYDKKNVEVSMLRLDEIHPVISGNKLFKLYYFLEQAKKSPAGKVITFGGAYSNHLAATAFACKKSNLKCIGFIRGEKPAILSPTLLFCMDNEMQLIFLSREAYKDIKEPFFLKQLNKNYGDHILIPEGGFSEEGANGAALIPGFFNHAEYTHVCLAVGTATTFAGIINGSGQYCETLGISVLKNMTDTEERLAALKINKTKNYSFIGDYHFGGYSKKTEKLISFMNNFYAQHKIPLDFVYTAKMMFGTNDLIQQKYFPPGSKILCIHTGGLQGNNSLKKGVLIY